MKITFNSVVTVKTEIAYAIDGTPVIDIKPYYPIYDKKIRIKELTIRLIEAFFR